MVYLDPGKPVFEQQPNPGLAAPNAVIVMLTKAYICGTDPHLLAR